MARLFGTDGVRGVANVDLTCELSYRLGQAAASFMGKTIVVGKDTRKSGDMLEAAVVAGITSAGGDALLTGVIPTPAVALLVRELHADGGIVISASHNPPEYNGIKFFDANGFKLPDAVEDEIEKFIAEGGVEGQIARAKEAGEEAEMPVGDEVGVALEVEDACVRDIYQPCGRNGDEPGNQLRRASRCARYGPWRVIPHERRGAAPFGCGSHRDQR